MPQHLCQDLIHVHIVYMFTRGLLHHAHLGHIHKQKYFPSQENAEADYVVLAVDIFWITKSRTIPPSLSALLNGIRKHELEEEAKHFAINHEKISGQLEKVIEDGETLQKAK